MYIQSTPQQLTFDSFNQSCGMQLDPNNEWVVLANTIDWHAGEVVYAAKFTSKNGNVATPFRQVLGSLIIQLRKGLSDRKLIKEIQENPYLQYFVGLEKFTTEPLFTSPALVKFRKRITLSMVQEINDQYLKQAAPTPEHSKKLEKKKATVEKSSPTKDEEEKNVQADKSENLGTMILDATCSPSNIRYPQDFSLLEEARVKTDLFIDLLHGQFSEPRHPRTYREVLRKEYLRIAKMKRRSQKKVRALIRKQLEALKRNLGFIDVYLQKGGFLKDKHLKILHTIRKLYAQQKEMFDEKKRRVDNRIVSIALPHIRPIVRGKSKTPVEFGAKYDVSIDEKGHARLETISFDPYNECTLFQDAVERYHSRTGHYPQRVLVDQIYRTKANRAFCKEHNIRMQGKEAGRPSGDEEKRCQEYNDNIDRIEVERFFSVDKRCCGAGLIMTKLPETTLTTIALAVFVANLFGIPIPFFCLYFQPMEVECFRLYTMEFFDL